MGIAGGAEGLRVLRGRGVVAAASTPGFASRFAGPDAFAGSAFFTVVGAAFALDAGFGAGAAFAFTATLALGFASALGAFLAGFVAFAFCAGFAALAADAAAGLTGAFSATVFTCAAGLAWVAVFA